MILMKFKIMTFKFKNYYLKYFIHSVYIELLLI